jgi:uracil-DNA glycosylase
MSSRAAGSRRWSAAPFVPPTTDLDRLAEAARGCTGCPLYEPATQTVFGRGSSSPAMVLVGEQPGDQEDREGEPFVGPAGRVLARCLEAAGVDPGALYLTNAVKHFKHEVRGKRRIHQKPNAAEIDACGPWLAAELAAVPATVVVAMGAVATRAVLGRPAAISGLRGRWERLGDHLVVVTYHPSSVLRAEEQGPARERELVEDLQYAWDLARSAV